MDYSWDKKRISCDRDFSTLQKRITVYESAIMIRAKLYTFSSLYIYSVYFFQWQKWKCTSWLCGMVHVKSEGTRVTFSFSFKYSLGNRTLLRRGVVGNALLLFPTFNSTGRDKDSREKGSKPFGFLQELLQDHTPQTPSIQLSPPGWALLDNMPGVVQMLGTSEAQTEISIDFIGL